MPHPSSFTTQERGKIVLPPLPAIRPVYPGIGGRPLQLSFPSRHDGSDGSWRDVLELTDTPTKNDAKKIKLPPASQLIVDAEMPFARKSWAGRSIAPHVPIARPVGIGCKSQLTDGPGWPLSELLTYNYTPPTLQLFPVGVTPAEVEKRFAPPRDPVFGFHLAGYNHLPCQIPIRTRVSITRIELMTYMMGRACEMFVRNYHHLFQAPGIPLGPNCPLECIRLVEILQAGENLWVGILVVV